MHVHFACIFLSFLSPLTVWSVSVSGCFYCRCPVAVLSKVVELAGDAPAGVLSGLAAGCHVIAVNAPADTPRLNEVDLVLHSLEQITVTKQPNGDVIIQ